MEKFVPLSKQSKQKQRAYHKAKRRNWGEINPVTRKPQNPRAYNRKKSKQRYEYEPDAWISFFRKEMSHIFLLTTPLNHDNIMMISF